MLIFAQAVNLVARHGLQVVIHEAVGVILHAAALDDTSLAVLNTPVGSVRGVGIVVLSSTRKHTVRTVGGGPPY